MQATASRDKLNLRINYVTATYFLLVKRKELEELQRRQESRAEGRADAKAARPSLASAKHAIDY